MKGLLAGLALALAGALPALAQGTSGTATSAQGALTLDQQVLRLFKRSCAECHDGSSRSASKGDFDHVLDPRQMIDGEWYLVPGDPEFSELFLSMISDDPDIVMPPPDADAHKPTQAEIDMVRDWIVKLGDTGYPTEKPSATVTDKVDEGEPAEPNPVIPPPPPEGGPPLSTVFARMHPLVVHTPVAVIPMAAIIAALAIAFRRYDQWLPALRWSLVFGALAAPVAVITGWNLADISGYREETVGLHRWLGVSALVVIFGCLALVEWTERKAGDRAKFRKITAGVLIAAAILIAFTGHSGGEIVYGEGYPFN
ncbi:MAG: c-type cytochrome domain-containing protein [Opitutales bacterium]